MKQDKLSVTVFYGGISSEREISLETGRNIAKALEEKGMQVNCVDVTQEFIDSPVTPECDVAFIALHGKYGEDGGIQSFFESGDVVYTGSSALSSALAMDKVRTQQAFRDAGVPVPESYSIDLNEPPRTLPDIGFPVVVKPSREGSTFGISVAKDSRELVESVTNAGKYDSSILIEKYIKGREFTVGILGKKVLPVLEIIPRDEIFSHENKYHEGASYSFETGLSDELLADMQRIAQQAYKVAGCSGIARVDFMLSESMRPYVLEINTVPGMTSHSLVPLAAKRIGISFEELCEMGVRLALSGGEKRN